MAYPGFYMKQSLINGIAMMIKCGLSQSVDIKKPSKNTRLSTFMNSVEF